MIDVTEQRMAEEEGRRLEQRLQQAQKMESLAILASGVAHDFNNLLVGILGNTDLIRRDLPSDSPMRNRIDNIAAAALRAADLTQQMLNYSGKSRFVLTRLDLNQQIEEMAHLLEAAISKTAEVRFELADDLPPIHADAS
jgi:signal transduction histidine kinase